jgi:hypothetical protein
MQSIMKIENLLLLKIQWVFIANLSYLLVEGWLKNPLFLIVLKHFLYSKEGKYLWLIRKKYLWLVKISWSNIKPDKIAKATYTWAHLLGEPESDGSSNLSDLYMIKLSIWLSPKGVALSLCLWFLVLNMDFRQKNMYKICCSII